MAREFFCAYHSLMESLTPFGDAECGRLFRAALQYSATGEEEEFRGNERFIWPTIKQMIDRDREAYEAKCKTNRMNGEKANGTERYRTVPNAPQEKEKDKDKDKDKEYSSPPTPSPGGQGQKEKPLSPEERVRRTFYDDSIVNALISWIAYKRERREFYKDQGITALLSIADKNVREYGPEAVAEVIRESMASRYQGIVWDKLKRRKEDERRAAKSKLPGMPKEGGKDDLDKIMESMGVTA